MSQYLLSVHHDAAGDAAMAETAPDQRVPGGFWIGGTRLP
jgi:hypothetical protein